nr:NAD(P)-dependent alcohol dehydrogenase [Rubinisphaera sp. JC750]
MMRAWRVVGDGGIDALQLEDVAEEAVGPQDVRVQMKACSLNYRDLSVVGGGYPRNDTRPVIALSDGAGEVVEVGENVTRFKKGDRVCPIFVRDWISGPPTDALLKTGLGGGVDGVLAENRVFSQESLVSIPEYLSYEQAATLPCAAVTAWHALFVSGELQPGQTVLLLGTGGVSIFALQMAKAAGAKVIVTSSSDEKLQRAKQLGADETINYREYPEWHKEVHKLTGGVGVDHVVEVGGPGTLERSLKAASVGGRIHLIGVLDSPTSKVGPLPVVFNLLRVQGIYVGSRVMFEQMNAAFVANQIEPVIDATYSFDDAKQAYEALSRQQHLGKIVITL